MESEDEMETTKVIFSYNGVKLLRVNGQFVVDDNGHRSEPGFSSDALAEYCKLTKATGIL